MFYQDGCWEARLTWKMTNKISLVDLFLVASLRLHHVLTLFDLGLFPLFPLFLLLVSQLITCRKLADKSAQLENRKRKMSQWASAFSCREETEERSGNMCFFSFHVKWQKFSVQSRERESQPWWKKKKKKSLHSEAREGMWASSKLLWKQRSALTQPEREASPHMFVHRTTGRKKKARRSWIIFLSEPLLKSYDRRWDLSGTVFWPFSDNIRTHVLLRSLFTSCLQ